MNKVYTRINWRNAPSEETPLNETNLNRIDYAVNEMDNRIIEQETTKVNVADIADNIKSWTMNETTGVITLEKYSGEQVIFDLNIEKIPVNFSMSNAGVITMTTSDGTSYTADIGSMIPILTFSDSDQIAVTTTGTGINKTYSFSIKTGSITSSMLETDYAAAISVANANMQASVTAAATSATSASDSASSAATSATNAAESETNASASATAASSSATSASTSATSASQSATSAATSAENANASETNASTSEANAAASENNASTSETNAAISEQNAATSEANAATSETNAENYSLDSQAWAEGKRGNASVPDTAPQHRNNAKYWAQQAQTAAQAYPMSGATDNADGRSGFVPQPLAGDNHKVLWGDGTWRKAGHTVVDENGTEYEARTKLKFINAEIQDDAENDATVITVQGGGGLILDDVSGAIATSYKRVVSLTWTDPEDIVVDGTTLARWGGTLVVKKEGSAPTNRLDGEVILDSTTKNAHSNTPLIDDEVDYGTTYYYKFFPYTTSGGYTNGSSVSCSPERVVIPVVPTQSGTLTYDGTTLTPAFNSYDSNELTIGGDTDGVNVGTYTATFTPTYDYTWSDGSRSTKNATWAISKANVTVPTITGTTKTYNRTQQSVTVSAYDSNLITVSGTSATNAGNYTVAMGLVDSSNYQWSDGTVEDKTVAWEILPKSVTLPAVEGTSKTYSASEQAPTIANYDANEITVSGTMEATNVGNYAITFSLTSNTNYVWSDETIADKTVTWSISKLELPVPTESGSLVFDGTAQVPTWNNYNQTYMTLTETAETDAGNYSSTFTLIDTDNTKFVGTNETSVNVSWSIHDAVVTIPTVTGTTKTYNGSIQSVTISEYDSSIIQVTGTSATNAGSYTVTMHLINANYKWSDNTTADKTVGWEIQKATASITFNPGVLNLSSSNKTATVQVSGTMSRQLSISAISDTSAVSASVSGTTVTVTALKSCTNVSVGVRASENANYKAAESNIYVSANLIPKKTFAAATDEELVQMVQLADAGELDLYEDCGWRVGQEREVTLSAMSASVLAEPHASQKVTLVLMDVLLYNLVTPVLDIYGEERTLCSFVVGLKNSLAEPGYMNSEDTNKGSWKSSKRRAWCNRVFYNAFPSSIRGIFKQFKTLTASAYNGDTNEYTEDYFALPAEKEVFGRRAYSNSIESNGLTQFEYYATSANRIKKLGDAGSANYWWERSPFYFNANGFCAVDAEGNTYAIDADNGFGLAPFGCI